MEERETVFGLLGAYLKGKVRTLLYFLISAMAFCLIYALYRLPWGPVLYCGMISLTAVLLFGVADFVRFFKRHRHLTTFWGRRIWSWDSCPSRKTVLKRIISRLPG